MRSLQHIVYDLIYKPFLKLYLRTDSAITFDGFQLKVLKGVFHPKLFFSTPYFYSFIKKQNLQNLKFLEIGSGSGLLSLLAARKGATVTAIDISPLAVETTALNFKKNFSSHSAIILQSDLFTNLPPQSFDVIVINPPYFFKDVTADSQYAWYCGAGGEYFERLFSGLGSYTHAGGSIFMILADNCEIDRIRAIASKNNITFELAESKQIKWEKNFIFKLSLH